MSRRPFPTFEAGSTRLSFEFCPPRDEASRRRLRRALATLDREEAAYVSVTYGAGGSSRDQSLGLVDEIAQETRLPTLAHLTGVGHTRGEIAAIVAQLRALEVEAILALAGDPRGTPEGDFRYAIDLVKELRSSHRFGGAIGVAGYPDGHPTAPDRLLELDHLKAKVDAGADFIVTQLCFDARDILEFQERCAYAGIDVPLVAGVMPVPSRTHLERVARFAERVRIPVPLLRSLDRASSKEEARQVGLEFAQTQCETMINAGIAGIHFYTLNRPKLAIDLFRRLSGSAQPAPRRPVFGAP